MARRMSPVPRSRSENHREFSRIISAAAVSSSISAFEGRLGDDESLAGSVAERTRQTDYIEDDVLTPRRTIWRFSAPAWSAPKGRAKRISPKTTWVMRLAHYVTNGNEVKSVKEYFQGNYESPTQDRLSSENEVYVLEHWTNIVEHPEGGILRVLHPTLRRFFQRPELQKYGPYLQDHEEGDCIFFHHPFTQLYFAKDELERLCQELNAGSDAGLYQPVRDFLFLQFEPLSARLSALPSGFVTFDTFWINFPPGEVVVCHNPFAEDPSEHVKNPQCSKIYQIWSTTPNSIDIYMIAYRRIGQDLAPVVLKYVVPSFPGFREVCLDMVPIMPLKLLPFDCQNDIRSIVEGRLQKYESVYQSTSLMWEYSGPVNHPSTNMMRGRAVLDWHSFNARLTAQREAGITISTIRRIDRNKPPADVIELVSTRVPLYLIDSGIRVDGDVAFLSEVQWHPDPLSTIPIRNETKETVLAMAGGYPKNEPLQNLMDGKLRPANGLVFLLYGCHSLGVALARGIGEHLQRPVMSLSPGPKPNPNQDLEELAERFHEARSYDAIVFLSGWQRSVLDFPPFHPDGNWSEYLRRLFDLVQDHRGVIFWSLSPIHRTRFNQPGWIAISLSEANVRDFWKTEVAKAGVACILQEDDYKILEAFTSNRRSVSQLLHAAVRLSAAKQEALALSHILSMGRISAYVRDSDEDETDSDDLLNSAETRSIMQADTISL